ncbi:MAG: ATP-binding protein [Nitriliruptorales bacterium]|nr:ATP-binding protein [Nitriliruptorales bacterium]
MSGADVRTTPIERYIAGLGVLAVLALAAHAVVHPLGELTIASALLAAAAGLSTAIPIRFLRDGGIEGLTVDEAMLVALLFGTTTGQAPLLLAGAVLVAHLILRNGADRVLYNASSVALASIAATGAFQAVGSGQTALAPRSLLAIVVAVIVYNLVVSLSLAELFRRLDGQRYHETLLDTWQVNLATLAGNAVFGVLLATVVDVHPFAVILAVLLIVGLHLGYRGYAGVVEERARNERLHEVARTLAEATGSPTAMGRFLRQVADLFGGEAAELLIRSRGRSHLVRWTPDGEIVERVDSRLSDPLEATLRDESPVRVSIDTEGTTSYRDAIAAPLLVSGELVGGVAVYDRRGLEPWGNADLNLLSSLASEAAVAVRNAELVSTLREETKKLGDIVEAASDGIVLLDLDGAIRTWSPAMARMTSVSADDAIGVRWAELLPVGPAGVDAADHVAEVLAGHRRVANVEIDLTAPSPRWLAGTVSPVLGEDGTEGAVLVIRDVTAARETDELKADFVATVSHELRTPLTPLKGFLDTMAARWDTLDRGQVESCFDGMQRQMARLESLVGDLLVVADLERDGVSLDKAIVDVAEIAGDVVAESGGGQRRIRWEARPGVRAMGDAAAIARIVSALVDNALKHTAGTVFLSVVEDGDVRLEVTDEGPGIPAWEQDRIFERFGRAGNHLHRSQGPGLGLTIAQSLAERLGGAIELESEMGVGSTFRLRLPAVSPLAIAS